MRSMLPALLVLAACGEDAASPCETRPAAGDCFWGRGFTQCPGDEGPRLWVGPGSDSPAAGCAGSRACRRRVHRADDLRRRPYWPTRTNGGVRALEARTDS